MKFSIVMPIYNMEELLEAAVCDVLSQTYRDFELILVDDCSTDGTSGLCDRLACLDTRIRVTHLKQNRGLSNARNTGMEMAVGDYILFPDPDDRYECCLLEQVADSLACFPAQMVLFGLTEEYCDKSGKRQYRKVIVPEKGCCRQAGQVRSRAIDLEHRTLFGYAWNKAYKLEFLRKHGLRFLPVAMIEDVLFNLDVFEVLDSLSMLDQALYHYMIRDKGSLTKRYLPDYFELHKRRVQEFLDAHERWGLESEKEMQILGSIYCRYFLSALQRNCSPEAHMPLRQRKAWVQKEFKSDIYIRLREHINPDNRMLHALAWCMKQKNGTACLLLGRAVYTVKEKMPGVFVRAKQNR